MNFRILPTRLGLACWLWIASLLILVHATDSVKSAAERLTPEHWLVAPPAGSTLTVNSTGDVINGTDGLCTLREAITAANSNAPSGSIIGECAAGSSSSTDTIDLTGVNGTISLVSVLPSISGDTSISGSGPDTIKIQRSTASGTPQFRIFLIQNSTSVTITGVTLANGSLPTPNNGGGIYNSGTLTLTNCNLFGNSVATNPTNFGGAIFNTSSLTLNDCKIGGNSPGQGNTATDGGGIYNQGASVSINGGSIVGNTGGGLANVFFGQINLTNVSITNNTGITNGLTGGISNGGTATITNCLIANNSSGTPGAGFANNSNATLTTTTLSGNGSAAGGGGLVNQGGFPSSPTITLNSCTITNNNSDSDNNGGEPGGGILRTAGTVTLNNTIVAGNFRGTGITTDDVSGTLNATSSFNLIGVGGAGGLTNGPNGNQVGVANPVLGPLADNSGPTQTHALLPGSPAIDAGNSTLTTDQRGQPRPIDDQTVTNAPGSNASDIGAYEAHTFQVNSLQDTTDGACSSSGTGNGCTLREAITSANAENGEELILFSSSLTAGGPATINLLTALPALSGGMRIVGPGANLLTIQRSAAGGTPNFRIFNILSGTVTITGVTISRGNFAARGGGILNSGTLNLTNSVISGNAATIGQDGGGIFNDSGTVNVTNCTISGTQQMCLAAALATRVAH